jgi:cytochrome c-type biogenesis protein CcmH
MNPTVLFVIFGLLLIAAIVIASYPFTAQTKWLSCLSATVLLVGGGAGYWRWGAWPALQEFAHQQAMHQKVQAAMKSLKKPQDVIEKLTRHLQHDPKSAQGWYLLGRIYASQNRWTSAFDAFNKAHQLESTNEQFAVNYAQSLWQIRHQTFDGEIRILFLEMLKTNPKQPDSLSMLAMDAFQSHDYQRAIQYWTQLLAVVSAESADANVIRRAIARANTLLHSDYLPKD